MASAVSTIVNPVKDLEQAKALYGALLGVAPYADEPYYVGFRVGDQEVGLDPNGHSKGMTGPIASVKDADGNVTGLVQSP